MAVGQQLLTPGTWTYTGTLNVPRSGHTATLLNTGKVLIAGGVNSATFAPTNSAEIYDRRLARSRILEACSPPETALRRLSLTMVAGVAWRFDVSVDWNGDIRFRLTSVSAREVNLQGETTPVCGTQITKLAVADRYDAKLEFPNVRVWKDWTANGAEPCRGVARGRLPQRSR